MRIAILADIHGNQVALDAVVQEVSKLAPGPDLIVVNGDLINGTPLSSEVIDTVRAEDWLVIRGNHEFYYLDFGTERAPPAYADEKRWGQLHWLVERISPQQAAYLATLPDERTFYLPNCQPIRVAHGVPGHNRVGFYPTQDPEQVATKIDHVEETTLVSAHTHFQIDRFIIRGQLGVVGISGADLTGTASIEQLQAQIQGASAWWHLLNPGSVGLPLNGDVNAQFAVLDSVEPSLYPSGWQVTHYSIPYDRAPVLESFATSGMMDAGGIISLLFYWEVCTAEPEIILFYRWARESGSDPDANPQDTFRAYIEATGRDAYVNDRDPLR